MIKLSLAHLVSIDCFSDRCWINLQHIPSMLNMEICERILNQQSGCGKYFPIGSNTITLVIENLHISSMDLLISSRLLHHLLSDLPTHQRGWLGHNSRRFRNIYHILPEALLPQILEEA